ncbi:Endonuclease/exonuclease/phosphatase [Hygrophoropsis aurantiaca]|uniref:Endonuclease/exonuclease/phosphatase n=1 Tax=Hygrophoropsis aurantiaca TaxID=72124 RepID=A0ACB8AQQ9_9AGAM|nr:Endonuclease/exonuclease/phosphatase [Hygrophoropsis aurantiaca]
MEAALRHIQQVVFECKTPSERPEPCCVLLQEVDVKVYTMILNHEWIQRCFLVVPSSTDHWPYRATYGNVTLISRTLPVCGAFTIDFGNSDMRRNALFVDIKLAAPPPADHVPSRIVTIRLANTHLESLPMGARARPVQMSLIAEMLEEDGIHGGVVAGDMNAIGPSDLTITQDVGLADAWQGDHDDEDGYTWGYQPRCKFPPGRLDKVLFTIRDGFEVDQPERVGVGKKIGGNWISDHYGLVTSVHVDREE